MDIVNASFITEDKPNQIMTLALKSIITVFLTLNKKQYLYIDQLNNNKFDFRGCPITSF
jgi:hypothetical protein